MVHRRQGQGRQQGGQLGSHLEGILSSQVTCTWGSRLTLTLAILPISRRVAVSISRFPSLPSSSIAITCSCTSFSTSSVMRCIVEGLLQFE